MTDQERDDLLLRLEAGQTSLKGDIAALRKDVTTDIAALRAEADAAHVAIGERIHKSFMALPKKIDSSRA